MSRRRRLEIVRGRKVIAQPQHAATVITKQVQPELPKDTGNVELSTAVWDRVRRTRLALGITCAPRPGEPTLARTIGSLRAAGFREQITVFLQGNQLSPRQIVEMDSNIIVDTGCTQNGCVYNWTHAARTLLKTDVPWIILMQDDIEWCDNAADVIQYTINRIDKHGDIQRHRLGMLAAYTSPAMVDPAVHGIGWTEARFYGHTTSLWGALALCFPRESLQAVLDNKRFKDHDSHRALDYVVGDVMRNFCQPPKYVKVHVPSIVEHTGDNSTLFDKTTAANKSLNALRHGYKYSKGGPPWRKV